MGRASELDDWLDKLPPLSPEEAAIEPRPGLRLAPNTVRHALDSQSRLAQVIAEVSGEATSKVVALRDTDGAVAGVAIPAEQYLELVTSYIRDRNLSQVTLDNRAVPSDATLAELGVEQVDPNATWLYLGGQQGHGGNA